LRLTVRTPTSVLLGFAIGAVIGVSCPLILIVYTAFLDNTQLPRPSAELLLWLSAFAAPVAINGAIGACVTARLASQSRWPVTILPIALPVVAMLATLFMDSKTGGGLQYLAVLAAVFSWVAGRAGQRVGRVAMRTDN